MVSAPYTVRPRPAHTQGTTRCAYTPDGTKLVTVGSNNTIRLYKTGFDGEPINVDDCQEQNVAVATHDGFFIVGSEDGTVSLYSLETYLLERLITRCTLPVRDVALSPDGKLCAVASDELTVKVVGTDDRSKIFYLREHGKPTKHLAFNPDGSLLTLSCIDGIIYVYSMTAEEPELIRKMDGKIGALETHDEASSQVAWHPDGRAFAVPTPIRDIQVVSKNDWENQRSFRNGHEGDITAVAWSPNGAMLATAAKDKRVLVWQTKDQTVIERYEYTNVIDIAWHPTNNLLSFTTIDGEVYICPDFVSSQFSMLLRLPKQPAPFIHDPLAEFAANTRRRQLNGQKPRPLTSRTELTDEADSLLDEEFEEDDDNFVVDDDGAGYMPDRKRPAADDDDMFEGHRRPNKRANVLQPQYHIPFQPGATPWRGNRKYLSLNLIGFVWTVDQDTHNTVTVEFYDHDLQRDFHFTDTFLYDKACLNEQGTLFACPSRDDAPASLFYRPHETWVQRNDWRTELPKGESVLAMALGESLITITTSANYVRVYTLFGIPYRVYRPKSTPMVTCAGWRDYILTIGNGPCGADGRTRLLYSIENVKRDEICQNEDTVALPEGVTIKSAFFSDVGDPCIYDSDGTLLTLLHWRRPSRASWIPLLDTKLLPRLAAGRKTETYFPVAVADGKFYCIILKGGEQYPYFPRPLLSEFDFSIPLHSAPRSQGKTRADGGDQDVGEDERMADNDRADEISECCRLEQQLVLRGIQAAQMQDLIESSSGSSHAQQTALARLEIEINKALLQLLAIECREGEERGMRALEMVELMRDRTGRIIEAAGKVAERYGRTILGEKIREVGERRANGMDLEDL